MPELDVGLLSIYPSITTVKTCLPDPHSTKIVAGANQQEEMTECT